ncbi:sperm microtubule associated protein 2-like [Halichondria panicea]|uniref:sperm microtubule associated protein 2-like n=1 Tax=Halichondria panicea TaxID=6063 RepID=UPI00312B551F
MSAAIVTHPGMKMTYSQKLAIPKQSKAAWFTSFGQNVAWGNQEPMSPINPATLIAVPTERISSLARPKKHQLKPDIYIPEFYYSCGRTSQIWQLNSSAMTASPSDRISYLARHKTAPAGHIEHRPQFVYGCGRTSSIWQSQPRARSWSNPVVRPRTAELARPKQTHSDYRPNRQVETIVSATAMSATPSEYIESLARPKSRPGGPFRDPQWTVPTAALQATPSDRVMDLAKPKRLADGYQLSREVVWRISTGAKNAMASNRLDDLSKPIIRDTMDHVQFNPDAFNVSEAAKKAKASARIEELSQPITRGV